MDEPSSKRRFTISLDAARYAILEAARPQDGSMADAVRSVIDTACRADQIDHQNRQLTTALVKALNEMSGALQNIQIKLSQERR